MNLEPYAEGCLEIQAAPYDFGAIRDEAREQIPEQADNACIYTHNCMDIISRYERDAGPYEDLGGTYRADQWQEAMTAYAYGVASSIIGSRVEEMLERVEECAEALRVASDLDDLHISPRQPYETTAHTSENADGVLHWRDLEGSGPAWAIESPAGWIYTKPQGVE